MRAHGEKRSRKQEQIIAALLTCGSITEAAAGCGIAEATVHRWLKDSAFQTAYREARCAVVQYAIVQMQRATGEAIETLRAVMRDPEAPASVKVSAAKTIVETAVKAVELTSVLKEKGIGEAPCEERTLAQRIQDFAPIAEQLLEDIVTGMLPAPLGLRAKYANSALARAGYGEITKVRAITSSLSAKEIEAVKQRARAAARAAGTVVDGEGRE